MTAPLEEVHVSLDSQLIAPSPVDALLSRLDEPRVVAALNNLLDHADLLAILVVGLDGLVQRGDVISGALADAFGELRSDGSQSALASLDLPKLAGSLRTLSGAMVEATPALEALLKSDLTDPRVIGVISTLARSVIKGTELARTEPMKSSGVFALMRALKDDDVAHGLGFLIQVARVFGRELQEG